MKEWKMIKRYKEIQALRQRGEVVGYPLYLSSNKLGKLIPSIPKGKCVQVTASTNVGKSQFWRWYFLISPFIIYKSNPEAKFIPRFIIFLLEETYEQLYDTLVANFIFIKFKKIVEPGKLTGLSETIITDEELKLSEQVIPLVEELMSLCAVIDNVYHPTGLFSNAKKVMLENGKRFYTTLKPSEEVITEEKYKTFSDEKKKLYKFKTYIQNNSLEYFFVITDNVNLIEGEKKDGILLNEHQAIWRWSTEYAHHQLQKNYGCIIIDIVQQAAAAENKQYTMKGDNIIEKLKPSRDNYGENKKIARNADVILGLFAPSFYGVKDYWKSPSSDGYNLKKIGDYFRTIIILKNRIGKGFKEIPLFFNGAVNYFAELNNDITTSEESLINKGMYQKSFKKL
ncbi:MAG: hypothetical protein GY775_16835 [Candidatus Scalindua sp.]|nr:hypothetical protein [Candidatus Scalindua sp.]